MIELELIGHFEELERYVMTGRPYLITTRIVDKLSGGVALRGVLATFQACKIKHAVMLEVISTHYK